MANPIVKLMLDSGAFSAFSLGRHIDVTKYADFILSNRSCIDQVINLDVIASNSDPEQAAAAGMANYFYLLSRGIKSVPVFHAKENLKHLTQMLNNGADYVGVSGTSIVSPAETQNFYDLCFQYLSDSKGKMVVDTHFFGDTSPKSLLTFPVTSADSATWMIQAGKAARIKLQGKPYQIRSTKVRDTNYISGDDTGPKRQSWEEEIAALGLDPERVMNVTATPSEIAMIRSYLVAAELLQLKEKTRSVTKYKNPKTLISTKYQTSGGRERIDPCRILLVLSPSAYYFNLPLVHLLNIKDVLISYYYIETAPKKFWPERLEPFLYDPYGFCQTNAKCNRYWEKMCECLLVQPQEESALIAK